MAHVQWFAITVVRALCLACAACAATSAPPAKRPTGPSHDPDHARGALPDEATRRTELALVQHDLDTMYAHRLDKIVRYQLDETKIFADGERRLLAATSWLAYDAALYNVMVRFHDGHLGYRPPQTAAPKVGWTSFRLGLKTVLGKDQLLVSEVEPGSEVAIAGVLAGDEVTTIDGRAVTDVLKREAVSRADARPRSALVSYAKTWTSTLVPKGDAPRTRSIVVARRSGGDVTVDITPHLPVAEKREVVSIAHVGDVAVVTIPSLESGKSRGAAIDKALAEARGAKGIVIDLRGNRGGIDKVGNRVVAGLAPGKALLGRYRVLVTPETLAHRPMWKDLRAEHDGFSAEQVLTVDGLDHAYAGKIAIVIDAGCISTCEIVTSALRADVGAVLIGEVTGGSSGAPISVLLPASRGSIQIPTWNLTTVDGKTIEDDGVAPDIEIYATPDALADDHDAPLDAAIAKVAP